MSTIPARYKAFPRRPPQNLLRHFGEGGGERACGWGCGYVRGKKAANDSAAANPAPTYGANRSTGGAAAAQALAAKRIRYPSIITQTNTKLKINETMN